MRGSTGCGSHTSGVISPQQLIGRMMVATPSGAASWTQPLAHPVWDSAGTVLNTRSDVCRYILALPPDKQSRNAWLRVAGLLLEGADVARLTCQLERALLLDDKLDIP
jgi:hypothetical protein